MSYIQCPSIVATRLFQMPEYISTQGNFIFLEMDTDVGKTITQLHQHPFWKNRFENHFIVCTAVTKIESISHILKVIWEYKILNFVLVFVHKHLEIFSYNPFSAEKILNLTKFPKEDFFPDKTNNLYGHSLRVSIFDYPPTMEKFDNQWYGKDYQHLKMVTSMINATYTLYELVRNDTYHFERAYDEILNNKTDLCFVSHFQEMTPFTGVEYTYPHQSDALVLLMPVTQDIKKKRNLLSIFATKTWVLIVVLIGAVFLSMQIANKKYKSQDTSWVGLIHVWAAFLGNSIPHFRSKQSIVQQQLLLFIFMCLVFRTAFHTSLIGSYISPNYLDKMTNISEIKDTDLMIYTGRSFGKMVPQASGLRDKLVFITKKERYRKLYEFDPNIAYLLTASYAEAILAKLRSVRKKVPYYVLKEPLVPEIQFFVHSSVEHGSLTEALEDTPERYAKKATENPTSNSSAEYGGPYHLITGDFRS
ncbi:hypothetical protein TcasGA2_TC004097 [Tribolium castaneum]|uniref:Ionotropic glutamate receptor C-terminal domain-containing protein n=1 Tax=Tribolium castaneum TaxID=7070 RepID=D7GY57_TRICA|nr:hypothetical protein TcasGA2_TC004097 [Tribolium castaneum]